MGSWRHTWLTVGLVALVAGGCFKDLPLPNPTDGPAAGRPASDVPTTNDATDGRGGGSAERIAGPEPDARTADARLDAIPASPDALLAPTDVPPDKTRPSADVGTDLMPPAADAAPSTAARRLSGRSNHTCLLLPAGTIKCWGYNSTLQSSGRLDTPHPTAAIAITSVASAAMVSAGTFHTCAVTPGGAARCWGANFTGMLGNGMTAMMGGVGPADVMGLGAMVARVTAGDGHTCALLQTGAIKCWGANHAGQVGDGTVIQRTVPTDVDGLTSGVTAVAAGAAHSCALMAGGGIRCWGANSSGQVVPGTSDPKLRPMEIFSAGFVEVAVGSLHTCAVNEARRVKCWGRNSASQLGDGTSMDRAAPVDVLDLTNVKSLALSQNHSCALTLTGGVKCWGSAFGSKPTDVPGLTSGVEEVAIGLTHGCALMRTGKVMCWGGNASMQLGNNSTLYSSMPVEVWYIP